MKGKRLPTLQEVAKDTLTVWQTLVFSQWYGYAAKTRQVATGTALCYYSGKVPVPIRWVLLKDPEGKLQTSALLATDLSLTDQQVIACFARPWAMEVTFQEVRTHLGVETQRQWSSRAIARRPLPEGHCPHDSCFTELVFLGHPHGR